MTSDGPTANKKSSLIVRKYLYTFRYPSFVTLLFKTYLLQIALFKVNIAYFSFKFTNR